MKRVIYGGMILFWAAMGALWFAAGAPKTVPERISSIEAGAKGSAAGAYTASAVAMHDHAADCWLIVRGRVYDVTRYVPLHPTGPEVVLACCGRDATRAFETKDRGKPHSPYAWKQLERNFVAKLLLSGQERDDGTYPDSQN